MAEHAATRNAEIDLPNETTPSLAPAAVAKRPGPKRLVPIALLAAVLAGAGGYWLHARHYEDTDDAQIDGSISNVSPRVPGVLVAVHVSDNQIVKAGDVLAEIDPTDYEVAVAQAKAALAQAEAALQAENPNVSMTETTNESALSSAQADVASAGAGVLAADREVKELSAQLEQAKAHAKNAEQEKARAEQLMKSGAITQAELDARSNAFDAAAANVAAVTAGLSAAEARRSQAAARITAARAQVSELQTNAPRKVEVRKATLSVREAALELARAQLHQAELNLGYTKIVAPVSGIVGRKSMSIGDRVAPGQQLVAVARVDDLWVTANFRETQLRDMQPGQPATIHVDALDLDLHGEIDSVAGATGSRFSLFPPENASGNYVKVVQRMPVKLRLDPGQPGLDRLRPGMSVEPEVRVR